MLINTYCFMCFLQGKTQVPKHQKLPPINNATMTTNEVFEGIGDDDL